MELTKGLIAILLTAILTQNFVLSKFLGICPFLGVSKKLNTAVGMSAAVIFVMALATAATYPINTFLLEKNGLGYLQTIVFILVIAALVQLVEIILKKYIPALYSALGIYLPLITTNCAVLGVALLNVQKDYNILVGTIYGFATAAGYWIVIVLLSFLRERITDNDIPRPFKGFPIVMVTAALMSIAFFGFAGIKF